MRQGYVELNRAFLDFDEERDIEGAAFKSYIAGLFGELTWEKLLQSRYVVILGEAGSGKTWEMEAQTEKLREQGRYSFLIRVDALASQSFDVALDAHDVKFYSKWQKSNQEATFFLDSIDEAKLQKPQAFRDALNTFAKTLGSDALSRARLVLSCRVSEWRGKADIHELRIRFAIPQDHPQKKKFLSNSKESPPQLRVVELAPLDSQRVELLASRLGVDNIEEFIAAIDGYGAWDFAGRPKDVENLVGYWRQFRNLADLTDLIAFDVSHKLQESSGRVQFDPLSAQEAELGAQLLAAAVLFCKRFTFLVPDEPLDPQVVATSIEPKEVLPEWPTGHIRALLSRAIFDEATYGKVRFHHRSVAEFLAAQWVAKRQANGCPIRQIHQLLFAGVHGREVVIPSRAPIAAWLSIGDQEWRRRICKRVLEINPEILIIYGDPQALPLETRRSVLKGIIDRYAGRSRVRIDVDAAQLRRLAHNDLSGEINEYISNTEIPVDVREFLLRVVQHGKLSSSVEVALSIIANQDEEEDLREQAVLVVHHVGTQEQLRNLAEVTMSYSQMSSQMCGLLCAALYPKALDVNGLIGLVKKVDNGQENGVGHLQYLLKQHLSEAAPEHDLPELLVQLIVLVEREPHISIDGQETPVSDRYHWLGDSLFEVVRRLLKRHDLDHATSQIIVHALFLLQHFRQIDYGEKEYTLQAETEEHPEIRREYVWTRVSDLRSQDRSHHINYHGVFDYYSIFELSAVDLEWLIRDVKKKESGADKEIALSLAIYLWSRLGYPAKLRPALKHATRGMKNLRRILKEQAPCKIIAYPKRFYYRFRHDYWWTIRRYPRRFRKWWNAIYLKWQLWKNAVKLHEGKATGYLYYLASYMPSDAAPNGFEDGKWQDLVPKFGKRVANAARAGWKAFWRTFTPLLPHERPDPNRWDRRVVIGLTGIKTAVEDGLDITTLNDTEAIIATRYALCELNSFPDWFAALARSHPGQVLSVLRQCIDVEWSIPGEQQNFHGTLTKIRYGSENIKSLVAPRLTHLLLTDDPAHRDVLNQTLDILIKSSGISDMQLSDLAARRIQRYQLDNGRLMVWLVAWMHTGCARAIDFVEQFLLNHPAVSVTFMVTLGAILSQRRSHDFPVKDDASYEDVACLGRLIPLFYQYVLYEEDVHHTGVFTPTDRDDAQNFRSTLLDRLYKSTDRRAFAALQQLTDNPSMASVKDWLLHLLDKRAELDAEGLPWKAGDIPVFMHDYETEPRSPDALFQIALNRLDDIRDSVESADFSRRTQLRPGDPEDELQKWLADQIETTSQKKYSVVREAEVDRKKKPDIRLVIQGLGPVTIEVKWANRWSYSELEAAFEDQLIGQYMKANSSRHGILLLANIEQGRTWKPEVGVEVDFKKLIRRLGALTMEVLKKRSDVDDLSVVGIDFTA